jgi:hypothetical protein
LTQLVALATRTTPLVLSEASEQHVTLRLNLPKGAQVGALGKKSLHQGDREVVIDDRAEAGMLVLDRNVRMPAGRVAIEQYAEFSRYLREASDALSSQFTVRLGTSL